MSKTPSTIEIIVGGEDITNDVLPSATFDAAMNAAPGSCQFTVRDRERTHSFITGDEILVRLDGQPMWGGILTSTTRKFALPAVDTSDLSAVTQRMWVLRGVDFNILLDKRVLRNTADYLHSLPRPAVGTLDGAIIQTALANYVDDLEDFDTSSQIDSVLYPADNSTLSWAYPDQGAKLRALFEDLAPWSGAVYFIGPDKTFYYKRLETQEARWGFSDDPNRNAITASPDSFQGSTIGFREIEGVESGGPAGMVNDAMIWGGSEWSGAGGTLFARRLNEDSIALHGLWQTAETGFGETGYENQQGVDARAEVIVNGTPPSVPVIEFNQGLRYPQWMFSLTWFAHDVPRISGVPDHLHAGQLVRIQLKTFGPDGDPLVQLLPLRALSLTFVGLHEPSGPGYDPAEDEIAFAQLRGSFGLQPSDPFSLWRYLLGAQRTGAVRRVAVSTVDGNVDAPYGSLFTGAPEPVTDGVETVFELPDGRGYIAGTTEVYLDGSLLRRGIDYTESDPANGEITLVTAPDTDSWLWISARTTTALVSYIPPAGIVGFGRNTTGGASGTVYTVSTWSAFKSAVQASGARIIRFTAGSYTIDGAADHATMDDPDLTIDGTGWTGAFKRATLNIRASNAYLTELRLRPGDDVEAPDDADALSINPSGDSLSNVVIDRCSLLWAPDVILAVLNNVTDVTIQYCMIGAGLRESTHSEAGDGDPGHSYGGNVTTIGAQDYNTVYGRRITFYRNYIFHNYTGRNIRGLYTDNIEYVNNVVYNWGRHLAHPNPRGGNFVGNMFKKGPGTPASDEVFETETHGGSEDAYLNSVYWPTTGADANLGIGFTPTENFETGSRRTTLYRASDNGAAVTDVATASEALADEVVAGAGPSVIDEVDQIFKDDWANDTGDYWNGASGPAPHPYWP